MKSLNPNNVGRKFVVEECQKIEINSFLRSSKRKLKEALIKSELEAMGVSIKLSVSITHFGGVRYWFSCPLCGKRTGTLFVHPIELKLGCRYCLDLEYKKRRFKGMVENFSAKAN